ncbi:MAG: hemolysin family protein [Kiritimatiellia bacterium]
MSALTLFAFSFSLIILLCLSAFFSGCETAMLSLSPLQIQRISERNRIMGERLSALLAQPEVLLSTLLIGNTFVNAALASVGFAFVAQCGWVSSKYVELVSIVGVTGIVLLFGEISPKQFAIRHAERITPWMARILRFIIPVLYPLTWCLRKLLKPFRKTLEPEQRSVSDAELMSVVNLGAERGDLDIEEGVMVRGILRLSELHASDVMTPRIDLIGLDVNDPASVHEEQMRRSPFVWIPLWNDSADNLIDFIDVSRYLLDPQHNLEQARCLCTTVVPENICLDDLLILLYRQNLPMVVVADEYGGTAGIVSRGDILEILSLETGDKMQDATSDIRQQGSNCWVVAGDAALEQINFQLGTHLDADDADRISGWITFHSGHIPRSGEAIEADGYRVTVQKMRRRKILTVMLEDLDPSSQASELHIAEDGRIAPGFDAEDGGLQ